MRYHLCYLLCTWLKKILLTLCLLWAASSQAMDLVQAIKQSEAQAQPPLLPRSQFIESTPLSVQSLSPDGQYLSYVVDKEKHSELWIVDLANNQHRLLLSNKHIKRVEWASNSHYLFIENNQGVLGTTIKNGAFALIITSLDESKDEYFYGVDNSHEQAVIVSKKLPSSPTHQLIRINTAGKEQVLYSSPKRVLDFLLADNGELIFIKQQQGEGATIYDLRQVPAKSITHCQWFDKCSLQAFQASSNTLLLKARFEQDLLSLFAIELDTQQKRLLHQDPQGKFDLTKVYFDQQANPKLAIYQDQFISVYGLDNQTQQWMIDLTNKLNTINKQSSVWLIEPNQQFNAWLAVNKSSRNLFPETYVYQQTQQSIIQPLADLSALDVNKLTKHKSHMANKITLEYQTSDGMRQFGYLTLPLGRDIATAALVVKPHGGPWSRVTGGYDPLTQFLANRGFVVFEPNFRASIGMGKHYVVAANQDFGKGRVQQDIIDGLYYVLAQGVGDKNKLAIFGHSFGGFSTLAALAFTPQLFKVGIAGAPPTDMAQSVKLLMAKNQNDRDQVGKFTIHNLALDPQNKEAMLRFYQKSPDAHWQNIKRPLYIIAGGQDPKVAIARVKDFSLRLQQANKPISLLVDAQEGHSPKQAIAREAYFYMLEKALANHLHSDYQPNLSENLRRYLGRNLLIDTNQVLTVESST